MASQLITCMLYLRELPSGLCVLGSSLKIMHSPSILVEVLTKLTESWCNNIHHLSSAGLQDPSVNMEVIERLQICGTGCCTTLFLCWLTSCHHCISITMHFSSVLSTFSCKAKGRMCSKWPPKVNILSQMCQWMSIRCTPSFSIELWKKLYEVTQHCFCCIDLCIGHAALKARMGIWRIFFTHDQTLLTSWSSV